LVSRAEARDEAEVRPCEVRVGRPVEAGALHVEDDAGSRRSSPRPAISAIREMARAGVAVHGARGRPSRAIQHHADGSQLVFGLTRMAKVALPSSSTRYCFIVVDQVFDRPKWTA